MQLQPQARVGCESSVMSCTVNAGCYSAGHYGEALMTFIATRFGTVDLKKVPQPALQSVATELKLSGDPRKAIEAYILGRSDQLARPTLELIDKAARQAGVTDCVQLT